MSGRREPGPEMGRQTNVTTTLHTDHDLTLVAALSADDLTGPELDDARSLVAACPACGEVYVDLVAIASATRALPSPVRPRDFRLTEEQAVRLRPGGWRRIVAGFGAPRLAFARPLGVGLATVGLAGLMLTAVVPDPQVILSTVGAPVGDGAGAGSERDTQGEFGGEPAAPEVDTAATPPPAPMGGGGTDEGPAEVRPNGVDAAGQQSDGPGMPWIPIGSVALIGGGVALVLLRRAGERA